MTPSAHDSSARRAVWLVATCFVLAHCGLDTEGGASEDASAPGGGGTGAMPSGGGSSAVGGSAGGGGSSASGGSFAGGAGGASGGGGSGGTTSGGAAGADASLGGTGGTSSGGSAGALGGSGGTLVDASTGGTGALDAGSGGSGGGVGDGGVLPCTGTPTVGQKLTLQNATATFSQTAGGSFGIGTAIDGSKTNSSGWAIYDKIVSQTAAFETATDTPSYATGTRLIAVFTHNFTPPPDHALGSFRLSVTTANRNQFADGNQGKSSPGNVGASGIWVPVTPVAACASNSAIAFSVLPNLAVLVAEHDITPAVYTVSFETPVSGITGIRLEALEHPSLPFSGPGLQDTNGNFVLTELEVFAEAK